MPTYRIERINGLIDSTRRAVVFLECSPEDKDINARLYYLSISEKIGREFLSRFDYWLKGGTCDKYFHGFPNDPERKHCFVFKKEAESTHQRLYGFLTHPKPGDLRFQACILVHHTQKTDQTDPTVISLLERFRLMTEVQNAVATAFLDKTNKAQGGATNSGDRKNCKHRPRALDHKKR